MVLTNLEQLQRTLDTPPVETAPRGWRRLGLRLLHIADVLVLLVVLFGTMVVRFGFDWPKPFGTYALGFGAATAIHMVIYYFGGLYEATPRLGARTWLPRASALTALAVLLDGVMALLTQSYLMPRANLFVLLIFGSIGISFNRWLVRRVRVRRFGQPRVLLVGNPDDINLARSHLEESEETVLIAGQVAHSARLGEQVSRAQATDVLLLSGGTQLEDIYPDPLEDLENRRIGVYHRISPADTLLGLQRSRQIAGMPFVQLRAHALAPSRAHFKRCTETLYLAAAAPLLLVVGLLVAIYTRICCGKGIFYRQARVGRFEQPFTMLKFRTMHKDAEEYTGAIKAGADDPRVVRGMRWIRRTRLDELPQFINVCRGQMSIVGPRPERPEFAHQYEELIPGYGRRHDIPPGVTGLAQVHGSYHTDPGYKLGHDLQYLVNWSPILDLQIMVRTVWVVLAGKL